LPSGTPYDQIGQKIENFHKEHEKTSAGLAAAVFDKDGQTIYQKNFGYMDKEKKLAVDDKSVFEWGSATKLTVWLSVMQLWEEGKIDLKTDIKEYYFVLIFSVLIFIKKRKYENATIKPAIIFTFLYLILGILKFEVLFTMLRKIF